MAASATLAAAERPDAPSPAPLPAPAPVGATSTMATVGFSTALLIFSILATVALLSGPRRGRRMLPALRALRPQPFVLLPERPG
jgi:hypothetical protein